MIEDIKEQNTIDILGLLKEMDTLKPADEVRWFGVSGSWRKTNAEVESSVRESVNKILEHGGGIVTGGALNVDYFATDEALKHNPDADRIRVFLPVTLDLYVAHYRKRAEEGVITSEQAEALIAQLTTLRNANSGALIENDNNIEVNMTTYYERNTAVVDASDAVIGFQVNDSGGVEDTLTKAEQKGKFTDRVKYTIE